MIQRISRLEFSLYFVAFVIALTLRMVSIGQSPLSDQEAELALQAARLANGQDPLLSPHPAYLVLSSVWMFFFGASNWTARLWPALAGSMLVLSPALFKKQLGKVAAVFLAFFLALDPGFLAISITAGSPVLGVVSLLFSAGMLLAGRPVLAGLCAGMALLSGPAIWMGVIGAGVAFLAANWLGILGIRGEPGNRPALLETGAWRRLLVASLATIFLGGTLFFITPQGISAFGAGLPAYLQGWWVASGISAGLLGLGSLVYEFFMIFLGLWGAGRGLLQNERIDRILAVWWLAAMILVLVYPGRQMADLSWSLVPLAALAARQAVRFVTVHPFDRLPALGQATLAGLIMGYLSLTLFSMVNNPQFINESEYWIRLAGALIMLFASTGLIAWGWSKAVSMHGLVWGFMLILAVVTISSTWNVGSLSSRPGKEFWNGQQALSDERLLLETIEQLNQWAPPKSGGLDVAVVGVASPALQWALRDVKDTVYTNQLSSTASPSIIITPEQPDLSLAATYRGQSFVLKTDTGWRYLRPQEWLRWIAFRITPGEVVLKERIILWARTDLFPGDDSAVVPKIIPEQPQEEPQ